MEVALWRGGGALALVLLMFIFGFSWDAWDRSRELELRVTHIEGNRFTDAMGLKMKSDIMGLIAASYPPEWLKNSLVEVKQTLRAIEERLRKLEANK